MRLVGRAQTTYRVQICIACSIDVVMSAVLAISRQVESVYFSAPSIQKIDWRLASTDAGLGNFVGGLRIRLLEDAGYDPEPPSRNADDASRDDSVPLVALQFHLV